MLRCDLPPSVLLRYLLFNAGPAAADPHRLGFEDRSVLSNIALRASTPEQDLDETDAKDVLHARGIMLRLLRNVHPFAPVPDRRESPLSAADDMLPPQLVRLARTDPDAFARVLLPSGLIQNHFRAIDRPKNIANAPLVAVLARHGCSAAVDALLDGFCRHAETECGVTTQHFEYGHGECRGDAVAVAVAAPLMSPPPSSLLPLALSSPSPLP